VVCDNQGVQPSPTDEELLGRIAEGDRAALRLLFDRHADWLTLRLARRCGDPGLVDEAVSDTFLAAWRSARRYRGRGAVGAWLWGIAVRRLVDRIRRQPRGEQLVADVLVRSTAPSAEDAVLLGVEHGDLGGALRRLSPELRTVVQATLLDGLTMREAGRLLGLPTGTVKSRLRRARQQLREELA